MSTSIRFHPGSYDQGASQVQRAAADLQARTKALLGEVSDLSVLGTNDTLGGVAQTVYGVFLEVFQETVDDLGESIDAQGRQLRAVGDTYRDLEARNTELARSVESGL